MRIKKGLDIFSDDGEWYALTSSGRLMPEELCEKMEDAARVNEAIMVIKEYFDACRKEGYL